MKLYKKADRVIKTDAMLKAWREGGFETKHIGEWDKWKELKNDTGDFGKLQVKMDVYEIKNERVTAYVLSDTLGRICAPMTEDKQEVMNWLKDHGYKPDKQWYMEDYGMDEETWEEWNK